MCVRDIIGIIHNAVITIQIEMWIKYNRMTERERVMKPDKELLPVHAPVEIGIVKSGEESFFVCLFVFNEAVRRFPVT